MPYKHKHQKGHGIGKRRLPWEIRLKYALLRAKNSVLWNLGLQRMPKPRVVCTPGTLGGRPRLDGTRLGLDFFAANRNEPRSWFQEAWPYVTDAHLALMFAVVDAVHEWDEEAKQYAP